MDLMRQFDALMRTELSFHWQRTLSAVWVSGDWLGDWNGARSRDRDVRGAGQTLVSLSVSRSTSRAQHE